jgi:DNA invertase Pin-like site-specific DNA recombinase
MKAIGYIRVSTEDQVTEGVSLEAQEAKIRAWCDLNDYDLIDLQVDAGISGARADNRPGLQAAVSATCSHHGALIVYSLSRLARSTRDTIAIADQLDRSKADLVSISEKIDTTTAAGKMVFRMLAVLNEFERDQISERTRAAMDHLRRNNRRISNKIPYGHTLAADGKTLVPNRKQKEIITVMKELRAEGTSLRKIGAYLEKEGILSQSGGKWTATTIKQILDREARLA